MTMSDIKVAFQNLSYKYPLSPATRSKNFKSIGNSMALMERSGDRSVDCSVHIESAEEEGVCVTWEDLSVTAFDGNRSSRKILSGLTGFARPGQVLAIMGPSGCGKSTLLDALAGRLGSNAKQSGNILVNGRKQTLSFGTSAYVTQNDILMTTLTVKEAVYYSAELQLPNSMSKSEKRQRAEVTIKEMGLQDAVNTSIGGVHSKGISGGQRRRVSICIEILTRPKLLFLDEPTSGLDSAASFHVMNRIANLAKFDDMNTIASIHQPSSEVFELFDNLCLLSSGITVYFGPRTMANEVSLVPFEFITFHCDSQSTIFSRIQSSNFIRNEIQLSNVVHVLHNTGKENSQIMDCTSIYILFTTRSYRLSNTWQEVTLQVAQIIKTEGDLVKKGNQASFISQCTVLTKRSFVNMYRDLGYYWLRLAIYAALCLSIGTMFHNIGHDYGSIQARGSALMFVAGFLTFMGISGFPSFVEEMKIFHQERLNGHYGVTAFVISSTLSSAPYLFLVSVVPASLAYYLIGLQPGFDHFACFCLILYMCMLLVEGLMMVIASIVPNYLMGIIAGSGVQGLMMLCGGFFRLRNDIPKPIWRYPMYYMSFHKYANQGYYKNEFIGLSFEKKEGEDVHNIVTGEEIVRDLWEMEVGYSKWVDLGILMGMVILYRVLFLVIVKVSEKMKPALR
ncbi:ABC transporter G family member 11-like [Asparagus officinalis]|uniref:ABC transporter G family member 11-like n=1 Tax=Asparagus officinalis TaxID=4686 RepID=UPI00098E12E8|nr:ABC transporter G family member 11-like [Asparagus officinalis]